MAIALGTLVEWAACRPSRISPRVWVSSEHQAMAERRYQPGDSPVPGFVLIRFLGSGNFGEVWEARAAGNVRVALKILYGIDRKAGRKAFAALQLVENLRNPHLVPIIGFWLKDEKGTILDDDVDPNFSEDSTSSSFSRRPGLRGTRATIRPIDITPDEDERISCGRRPARWIARRN